MSDTDQNSASQVASARKQAKKEDGGWGEFIRTIVLAILVALGFRTVAYEPFNIPSESMLPTLLIGDYLLVSKFSYGYSKHSIPLSPNIFSGRIGENPVERGDIAVFKFPGDNRTDYIKRIIGMPGDKILVVNGHLSINDAPVKRERIEDFKHPDDGLSYPQYRETLPNGVSFNTLDCSFSRYGVVPGLFELDCSQGRTDNFGPHIVPEGHYFAMGDNRDNSTDSRVSRSRNGVGNVPAENLVGRADVIFFSTFGARFWEFWKWFGAARYERFFTAIK